METNDRFKIVYTKLREALDDEAPVSRRGSVVVHRAPEITQEELEEIENLRRIVLEVTEPVPLSFTTT